MISDRYAVDVVDAAHKVRNGNFKPEESLQAMKSAIADIDKLRPDYKKQARNGQESQLIAEAEDKLAIAHKATLAMIGFLEKGDLQALAAFTIRDMYAMIDPGTEQIAKIIDHLLDHSKQEYERSEKIGAEAKFAFGAIVTLAGLFGTLDSYHVAVGIVRPLNRSIKEMNALAAGISKQPSPAPNGKTNWAIWPGR